MSLANFIATILRVSRGKSLLLSGLLHLCALTLLAQTWTLATVEPPRLAGSRQAAIQLDASFREKASPQQVVVPAMSVEVTPHHAHAFNRTFVDMPSTEVDWRIDPMLLAPFSGLNVAADPSLTRAGVPQPSVMLDEPQALTLPRSSRDLTPPRTPTLVTPLPSTDQPSPPEYDFIPPPRYPELARQRGWQGTVLLAVMIDAAGEVTHVEVEESSGYQLLDAAAVSAVQRWRYKPAIGRQGPVATAALQPVTFRLPR